MKIEQIYTGCLAQGAYYIESKGEAAVIDPLRSVNPYIQRAEKDNAKIKYIFETHFHADFVSGHLDLAEKTGAKIIFGPTAKPTFDAYIAEDNEVFDLGDIRLKVLHTPGHTMESIVILLQDENGKDRAVFTGDTLFIGDVGRPDLAQNVDSDLTQEKLAGHLYDSLHQKILPLADDIIVYPAHGAGSACGKNMSKETTDTLGNQKKTNYALNKALNKEEFIEDVCSGLLPPPSYFVDNVLMNSKGYESYDTILKRADKALSVDEFKEILDYKDVLVLDTRHQNDMVKGYIPGAIFIGIDGDFAPWVGALIPDIKQEILIVADAGREKEVIERLARVGYDHAIGYLKDGFNAWEDSDHDVAQLRSVSPTVFEEEIIKKDKVRVLDVRKQSEFDSAHIEDDRVKNVPLASLNEHINDLDKDKTYYVHCAGGYRSVIASSILKSRGFKHIIDVKKGFNGIKKETDLAINETACTSGN